MQMWKGYKRLHSGATSGDWQSGEYEMTGQDMCLMHLWWGVGSGSLFCWYAAVWEVREWEMLEKQKFELVDDFKDRCKKEKVVLNLHEVCIDGRVDRTVESMWER